MTNLGSDPVCVYCKQPFPEPVAVAGEPLVLEMPVASAAPPRAVHRHEPPASPPPPPPAPPAAPPAHPQTPLRRSLDKRKRTVASAVLPGLGQFAGGQAAKAFLIALGLLALYMLDWMPLFWLLYLCNLLDAYAGLSNEWAVKFQGWLYHKLN